MFKHVKVRDEHDTDGAKELNAIAQRLRAYAFENKLDGEKLSHIVQDLVIHFGFRGDALSQIRSATGAADKQPIYEIVRCVERFKADSDELQRLRTTKVTVSADTKPLNEAMERIKPRMKEAFENVGKSVIADCIDKVRKVLNEQTISVLFSQLVVEGKSLYHDRKLFVAANGCVAGNALLLQLMIPADVNLYLLNEQGKGRLDDLLIQEEFSYHITEGSKLYAVFKNLDKRLTVFVDNVKRTLVANYDGSWRGTSFALRDVLGISPVVALFIATVSGRLEHVHSGELLANRSFVVTDGMSFKTLKS